MNIYMAASWVSWRLAIAALVMVLWGVAFPAQAADGLLTAEPEDVGMSSKRLERLSKIMQRYIDDDLLAGTVTLVARKGKVVHFEAQGYRHREANEPMTKDSIFVIMSMTKPIVSTALMMLFEEGYFLLDDPISNYLPEFADKQVIVTDEEGHTTRVDAARPITFRHVLTHTAGVDPPRDALTEEERGSGGGFGQGGTLQQQYAIRAKWPLAFHPGDEWRYGSSTNYVAMLVERISGKSLDDFLQERIFLPLGMHDTHYNVPESKVDRVAAVYSPSGENNTIELRTAPTYREPRQYFPGTHGLSSTAADYFIFHQMILSGGEFSGVRLLSPKTVNLMITNHVGDKLIYPRGPGYGFGLGYGVLNDPSKAIDPLTPGSFSWGGAWGTIFWVDPVEEMIGILMTQITSYRHLNVRHLLAVGATQAIIDSNSNKPFSVKGYEKLP